MKTKTLIALGLLVGTAATQADVLYNNTQTPGPYTIGPGVEFGDQIGLHSPDPANTTAYFLTRFVFEYYGTGLSGDEQVRLRFYENDGPRDATGIERPGSPFYESPLFPVANTEGATLAYDFNSIEVPDIFTWTVEFTGLTGAEEAGLNTYTPPTVGRNLNTYWQRVGGVWTQIEDTSATPVALDFGAYAEGTLTIVPEPGSITLFALGALGLLGFHRRSKFNR